MKGRNRFTALVAALSLLLVINACTSDPAAIYEDPPKVPPASSMEMDFSTFGSQQGKSQMQSTDNFSRAAVTALIMKGVVEVNLAIPRALLKSARNADAELNDNEKWEWSFSRTERDTSFEVSLLAERTQQDSVNWDFYVTNSNFDLQHQLFFNGVTNTQGTEGRWSYYSLQNTDSREQVSQINWTVKAEDDVQLKLTVTTDRHHRRGDYIDYTFKDSLKTAIYYDNSEDQQTEIQYNVDTRAGYIIAPNYNNGEKACWNKNLEDITCTD